jgi:predicted nucleotidyltransferase
MSDTFNINVPLPRYGYSRMQHEPPDLLRLTKRLEEFDVRYVLIGGMAMIIYGGDRVTQDMDIAIALDETNVSRVLEAFSVFNPRPMRSNSTHAWSREMIVSPWSTWRTDAGRVDLVARILGVDSFEGLYSRAQILPFGRSKIRVASVADLIAMKSASGRERDRLDVKTLLAISQLRESG